MRPPRPSYANVMSTVAVFIALGGTSYAVVKLPKGAVGERELRKNAVTGAKVKDGSLTAADLSGLTAPAGARGPRGADGPAGPQGPSDILVASRGGAKLSEAGGVFSPVATMKDVPAGRWWVSGLASLVYTQSPTDFFNCRFEFGGRGSSISSVFRLGAGTDGVAAATTAVHDSFVAQGPTDVTLSCAHHGQLPASSNEPRADSAQITAIRTANLEVR